MEFPLPDAKAVHVFTGASCNGPYGPGGWAVVLRQGDEIRTFSGGESKTTSNRLQLLAAERALSSAQKGQRIHLYTPSDYVQRGASQWIQAWQKRDWKTRAGQPVKNQDLWQKIAAYSAGNQVRWHLTKSGARAPESDQAHELAYVASSS